jgi:hypothetical protein
MAELAISLALIVLLGVKWDPFHLFMPDELQMLILCLVVAGFGIYAGMLFRRRARDEREALHVHRASQAGYLAGIFLLCALMVFKDLRHQGDPWLLLVLAGMVLAKLLSLAWDQRRR